MNGSGRSHGSITVINAMPCGIGATIGVDLWTRAAFSDAGEGRTVRINNDVSEDTNMARICVRKAFETAGETEPENWTLETDSEIPVSRGLKSSSCACNAILESVFDAIGFDIDRLELVKLGVSCAKEARVTVTGSFDDACGCGLGGFVITDNTRNEILLRKDIEPYDVLIHVPRFKIRKTGLPLDRLHEVAPDIRKAIDVAITDPLAAMTMNGRVISEASGVDNSIAEKALEMGALGAGMSGSGPAVAIVVPKGEGRGFADNIGADRDELIMTETRCGQ